MYFGKYFVVFFIRVIFEKIEMNIYVNFKDLSMLLIRNVFFYRFYIIDFGCYSRLC